MPHLSRTWKRRDPAGPSPRVAPQEASSLAGAGCGQTGAAPSNPLPPHHKRQFRPLGSPRSSV